MNQGYFYLGKIVRTVGLKGEFAIQLDVDDPMKYKGVKTLFLAKEKKYIEFKTRSTRVNGMQLIAAIESVNDIDEAKEIVGTEVFLPATALRKLDDTRFYFHEIPGYDVIDEHYGDIGRVIEVMERLLQPVLVVKTGFTEILIPLSKGIVQKVDRDAKKLFVKAPDGLIDIYLGKAPESEREDE